jgi:threonine dehydrogenase-like Zn-dependent dehydrogenase
MYADVWMHREVFAFAAHGSHAVVGVDAAMLVPDGIAAEDACYLPAVETALSLVQDARVIVGETVAVFGQVC